MSYFTTQIFKPGTVAYNEKPEKRCQKYMVPTTCSRPANSIPSVGYLPSCRIVRCISHSPGSIFHGRCLHSWNSAGATKVGVGIISPSAFRRPHRSVLAPSLVVELSSSENRLRVCVCDIHSRRR